MASASVEKCKVPESLLMQFASDLGLGAETGVDVVRDIHPCCRKATSQVPQLGACDDVECVLEASFL